MANHGTVAKSSVGHFGRYLAAAVGRSGSVLAVDPEPNMGRVPARASGAGAHGQRRAHPRLGRHPRLPQGSVDVVLIVDTYHHLDDRLTYLRGLQRLLRSHGRVAVIDWQKRELPMGPPARTQARAGAGPRGDDGGGLQARRGPEFLPYQYFLIFASPCRRT